MQGVDVTQRVWKRLLAVREARNCACCGTWTAGESAALALYGPLARRDPGPLVLAQIGQSLDGRVATQSGDARDISGPDGLTHLHRMRALVDGVLIGVRTALHDSPQLTVRLCPGPNPARIVVDPSGRLPDDAPMLRDDGVRRLVVQAVDRPRPSGIEVIRMPMQDGRLDPAAILSALRDAGIGHLLIEGGGITIANFLESGLISRLQVSVAPLLIGAGPQGLTTRQPIALLSEALRPPTRVFGLGSDVVFDCALTPLAEAALLPRHAPPQDAGQTAAAR